MELELENTGEEITRVRNVRRDVVLRAGVEEIFSSLTGGCDPLILSPEIPPRLVVVGGAHLTREYFPSPLVHHHAEGEERDLVHRVAQQQRNVCLRRWLGFDETD